MPPRTSHTPTLRAYRPTLFTIAAAAVLISQSCHTRSYGQSWNPEAATGQIASGRISSSSFATGLPGFQISIGDVLHPPHAIEPAFELIFDGEPSSRASEELLETAHASDLGAFSYEHGPYVLFTEGKLCNGCPLRCFRPFLEDVLSDHRYFYSRRTLATLTVTTGFCAVLANTTLDQEFFDRFQDHAVTNPDALAVGRHLGDWWTVVPALAAVWAGERLIRRHPRFDDDHHHLAGKWSEQSLRALLVGAVPVATLQFVIGASRPNETASGSHWKPFDDTNGVSGHAFVGAVPFLVAARHTERPLLKAAFFTGSLVSGYSRIYDERHYFSQSLLGWTIAYLAVEATDATSRCRANWNLQPVNLGGALGLGVHFRR